MIFWYELIYIVQGVGWGEPEKPRRSGIAFYFVTLKHSILEYPGYYQLSSLFPGVFEMSF